MLDLSTNMDDLATRALRYLVANVNNPNANDIFLAGHTPKDDTESGAITLCEVLRVTNGYKYYQTKLYHPLFRLKTRTDLQSMFGSNSYNLDILSYVCNPTRQVEISKLLTIAAIYKHMARKKGPKWRDVFKMGTRYSRYSAGGLGSEVIRYLGGPYIEDNLLDFYTKEVPYGHIPSYGTYPPQLLTPIESWATNTLGLEELCNLIAKSGVLVLYPALSSYTSNILTLHKMLLLRSPANTEEFLDDVFAFCTSPHVLQVSELSPNAARIGWKEITTHLSTFKPARASVLRDKYKRYNRVRTMMLLNNPLMLDDTTPFESDFMAAKFDTNREDIGEAVATYESCVNTTLKNTDVKLLNFPKEAPRLVAELTEAKTKYYYNTATAPAVAVCNVLRNTNNLVVSLQRLRAYVDELR